MDRQQYLDSLEKEVLVSIINEIFDNHFEPLGSDADMEFWNDVTDVGFYWTASGVKVGN